MGTKNRIVLKPHWRNLYGRDWARAATEYSPVGDDDFWAADVAVGENDKFHFMVHRGEGVWSKPYETAKDAMAAADAEMRRLGFEEPKLEVKDGKLDPDMVAKALGAEPMTPEQSAKYRRMYRA